MDSQKEGKRSEGKKRKKDGIKNDEQ